MKKIAGTIIPASIGAASVVLGLVVPAIPLLNETFGWYTWAIGIPMIVGGILCIAGGVAANWNGNLAYVLVMIGGLVGIVTLFALPSLRGIPRPDDERDRRPHPHYLLAMPVIVAYTLLVLFFVDLQDKTHLPITELGRNGLSLAATLWDADVFFGEIWFNLLLACMFIAMLSFKIQPGNPNALRIPPKKERAVLFTSGAISCGILVAMAFTWKPTFSIAGNWYETQFAYQLPAWPAIIGFAGVAIGLLTIKQGGPGNGRAGWVFVVLFLAIWLYLTGITDFNPHAIFNFSIPLHVLVTTMAFPCCLVVYAVEHLKARPDSESIEQKRPGLLFLPVLFGGLALVVVLQYVGSTSAGWLGYGDFFSPEIYWWWPVSHAWGWLFTGSTAIFAVLAIRAVARWHGSRRKLRRPPVIVSRVKVRNAIMAIAIVAIVSVGTFPVFVVAGQQWSERVQPMLLVNQVGYLPSAPKRVLFQSATELDPVPDTAPFSVVDDTTGVSMYDGVLTKNVTNRYGHNYMLGSFDALASSGRYHVRASVGGREFTSHPFEIGPGVYGRAMELALRFFYYQRCNYEVQPVVPGYDGHHACHLDDADVWNGTAWVHHDLTGGWHDAGDYNKYNSWFQTQWYCVQALAECAIVDPDNMYGSLTSLYDSPVADTFDEALWGAKYLINCVNVEGLQGDENRYRVWETVSGFRQQSTKEARMSYWGPPEKDWTTPRRVVFNEWGSTFVGYHRGYDVAGSLLQVARLLETYQARYPSLEIPSWFPWNASYLRQLADDVYNKHVSVQGAEPDDIQSYIGKFYYAEENGSRNGDDWTQVDPLIGVMLPLIGNIETWPLWFGWAGYYALGNIVMHHVTNNRPVPVSVMDKLENIGANHFAELFDEPFRVKHGRVAGVVDFSELRSLNDPEIDARIDALEAGQNVLFFGAERQTDMLTSAWLQLLACHVNATGERPEIVQSYLDWLFGMNPQGLCIMEGVGSNNFRQYHHRYSWARYPGGAVPGCIPNGLAPVMASRDYARTRGFEANESNFLAVFGDECQLGDWPGNPLVRDGVPSNPNEVWIPHNAMMLRIFTMMQYTGLFT